jgi:ABC-type phosphate/phosphonate transport system ATPase subunit
MPDEPTSGLDSTSAYEIISCLRSTAQELGVWTLISDLRKLTLDDCYCFDSPAFDQHTHAI